ncbi:MAG: IPT/TIG domain-containing protein [Vulcanimicrobiota bacterium]
MKKIHSLTGFILIMAVILLCCGCGGGSGSSGSTGWGGGDGGGTVSTVPVVQSCTANLTSGQTCIITGTGFGEARDSGQSTVVFRPQLTGGVDVPTLKYISWENTQIILITPDISQNVTYVVQVIIHSSQGELSSNATPSSSNSTTGTAPTTPPVIIGQSPNPATAGASVTITGTNFPTTGGWLTINDTYIASTFTSTTAVFTIPSGTATGASLLIGGGTGGSSSTYSLSISGGAVTAPVVTSCTTNITTGQTCTIAGSGFGSTRDGGQSTVSFVPQVTDSTTITSTTYLSWSNNFITCITPNVTTGVQYVIVVNRYTSSGMLSSSTTASSANTTIGTAPTTPPVIVSQAPNPAITGQSVTLTGTNFPTIDGWLTINGTYIATTFTSTTAVFTIPSGTATGASVIIGGATGGSSAAYNLAIINTTTGPTITSITPSPAVAGSSITITGTNFGTTTGTGGVKFDTTSATVISWTATSITCTVPNIAAGTYTLKVTTADGSTATASITVASQTGPTITSITPNPAVAGSSITITGTNFGTTTGTGGVKFDTTSATVISWTATSITCTVPNIAAGTYTLTVTTADGSTATASITVASQTGPTITSITPNSAVAGSSITITGTNFGTTTGTGGVKFGTTSATVISWTATSITCTVPNIAAGTYTLTVTTADGSTATASITVASQTGPTITSITPNSAVAGSSITITGTNFGTTTGTGGVKFGTTSATVISWTATSITCTVPNIAAGTYTLTVTTADGSTATASITVVTASSGKIYGLFVGINTYPSSPLNYCVNDVNGMKANLTSSALWSSASITTLTDSQATKSDIQSAIATIAGQVTANDTFFFYYSGHGSNYAGESYICPVDRTGYTSGDISATEMQTWVSAMNSSAKKVFAFDSCHSGGFIGKGFTSKFLPMKGSQTVYTGPSFAKQMQTVNNMVFLAACAGSETSVESSSIQHGAFTYYVMEGLGTSTSIGPAGSGGSVSAVGTFNYASGPTTTFYSDQHPQVQNNYSGNLVIKQ